MSKTPKKAKKVEEKTEAKRRVDYLVTYEVEGSRSKRHKLHAYSEEEAEAIMTKRLESQVASGEINGFKILSVKAEK